MQTNWKSAWLLMIVAAHSAAQTPKVEIKGGQSDVEAGRDFVAGKLIIGKMRIVMSGAQNVAEILRREPAVSVGKDGRLGLLGLPGFTQFLLDGQAPQGVDVMALDLAHVESIEIIKSATAATGPFGIAGTINIVRKKTQRTASAQVTGSANSSGGKRGANLSFSTNKAAADNPLSFSLMASAGSRGAPSESSYAEASQFQGERSAFNRSDTVFLTGELAWAVNPAHKLSFSPDLGRFSTKQESLEERRWFDGRAFKAQQNSNSTLTSIGLPLRWNWKIDPLSRLAVKLSTGWTTTDAESTRAENWSNAGFHQRRNLDERDNTNRFLDIDYNTELTGGHAIAAGAKLRHNQGDITRTDVLDGHVDASLAVLGTQSSTEVKSQQLFVQDEWRINKSWALNAGLSVEQQAIALHEGPSNSTANFRMWSPSLHLAQKIDGDNKRKLRLSLARTFQAPFADQLLLHPQINNFAPCFANTLCGANTIDTADSAGNPGLRPERALGLNLSYTHGVGSASELVAELYERDIEQKIGRELALQSVVWASVPRYVARSVNLGQATIRGLNLEARVAARDLWTGAPALDLSGSLGFAHSALSTVPGPDNRLSGQTPWRAKVAASYTPKDTQLKLNVDANLLPGDWVRNNALERVYTSQKFTVNASANWKINNELRMVLNLDNLIAKDSSRIDDYGSLQLHTQSTGYRRAGLRLEMKL